MFRLVLLLLGLLVGPQVWAAIDPQQVVRAARQQIGVTTSYDPAYRQLAYPGGDVPLRTGVCTDVVVRALREQGMDLQKLVHEDMRSHFSRYPQNWGLRGPDRNIDHRRVPNLMRYFERQGWSLRLEGEAGIYRPGDIVAWDLGGGLLHIGVVSDQLTRAGKPKIIHNIGSGAKEEDLLFAYRIIGHYRLAQAGTSRPDASRSSATPRASQAEPQQLVGSGAVGRSLKVLAAD